MPAPWLRTLLAAAVGVLALWLLLVGAVYVLGRRYEARVHLRDALRLLPDLLRLVHGLARDRALPRRARVWLALLLAYLAVPVDLVPDVIPLVGYADDVVAVVLVLRAVVRAAGAGPLERHWRGSAEGLRLVRRLSGTSG